MSAPPRIAISLGEPAGCGLDVVARALLHLLPERALCPVVIGDGRLFRQRLAQLGFDFPTEVTETWPERAPDDRVLLLHRPLPRPVEPGDFAPENGAASVGWVEAAVAGCRAGLADALVTAPLDKRALSAAGRREPGHTELLADLTGEGPPLMLLCGERVRVALLTTHLALREVPDALGEASDVATTLATLARALEADLGLARPRLGLAGLNPHAGDGGRFGDEETRLLIPAVQQARNAGVAVEGPLAGDTLFAPVVRERFDALVCCYHDQGLAPLKALEFDTTVNVTLNLPGLVRTSPGHGVAYDLAGSGRAEAGPTIRAIRLAAEIAGRRGSR